MFLSSYVFIDKGQTVNKDFTVFNDQAFERKILNRFRKTHGDCKNKRTDRLVSLNEDPLDFREIAWRDGVDFLSGYIDSISQRNDLYQKWSPKLMPFADQCLTQGGYPRKGFQNPDTITNV